MFTKRMMSLGALVLTVAVLGAAPARADDWGFSLSIGRAHAAPVYVAACGPPVVYYDYPAPVYYREHRYYAPPARYDHGGFSYYRHGHGRVYHHGHSRYHHYRRHHR